MIDAWESKKEKSFFERNKVVSFAIIISCMLFVIIFFMEKSKRIIDMTPMLRGEVSLANGFSITVTNDKYPILIKKDDPIVGSKLRFSGDIKSIFAEAAIQLAHKDDVVVEVGSHFGYNAIYIAKKLNDFGKYYAFEPNGGIFNCLTKTIVLNDLDKVVTLRNIAISAQVGNITIDDYLSMTKTPKGDYTKPRTVLVSCSTIDKQLAEESRPVSLLLIDVPGQEFSILKGAEKTIKNAVNGSSNLRIIMSFDEKASSKNFDVEKELRQLESLGFNFYVVDGNRNFVRSDVKDILSKNHVVVVVLTKSKLDF